MPYTQTFPPGRGPRRRARPNGLKNFRHYTHILHTYLCIFGLVYVSIIVFHITFLALKKINLVYSLLNLSTIMCQLRIKHTHQNTHACTHSRTESRTDAHAHSHTNANTHERTHTLTHTLTHEFTHSRTHAHTHTRTFANMHARTSELSRVRKDERIHTQCTHAHTHTNIRTHAYISTQTHAYYFQV